MSDRIASALAELVDALRAELDDVRPADADAPDRLYSIPEAAELLGIGRTALYAELQAGRLRRIKIGRRVLIPARALAAYSEAAR